MTDYGPSVLDVLVDARGLVQAGWTQGAYARNAAGKCTIPSDSDAVSFCALGALAKLVSRESWLFTPARKALESALGTTAVSEWNDEPGRTREEVLAVFDGAITSMSVEP